MMPFNYNWLLNISKPVTSVRDALCEIELLENTSDNVSEQSCEPGHLLAELTIKMRLGYV